MIHRLIAGFLIATLGALATAQSAKADLHFISQGKSNRIILFLDGLAAGPDKAFRWGDGVGSWPELMAADASGEAGQMSLGRYDTAMLSFPGVPPDRAAVPQLAVRALSDLKARGVLDSYQSIVFIAYGAGGLVLKSMLVQAPTAGAASLTGKAKAVFLLSVPAQGRPASDFLTALATHEGLAINFGALNVGVFLQGLESRWSEYLSKRGPTKRLEVYCRHESAPTFGIAVAAGQYTTDGCDDNSVDPAADHQSIARPGSRDTGVYSWVRAHLADYFRRFPSDPGQPVAIAAAAAPASTDAPAAAEAFTPGPPAPVSAPAAVPAAVLPSPATAETNQAFEPLPAPTTGYGRSHHWFRSNGKSARSGDWTFTLKGEDCTLNARQWVVHLKSDRVQSDTWNAKVKSNGAFAIEKSSTCANELVRGRVSGILGLGTYFYSDPCTGSYCRVRFKMTWRRPIPSSH